MKKDVSVFNNISLILTQILNTAANIGLAFITKNLMDSLHKGDQLLFFRSSVVSLCAIVTVIFTQVLGIYLKNEIIYEKSKRIRIDSMKAIFNMDEKDLDERIRSKMFSYFTKSLDIFEESYIRNKLNLRGSLLSFIFSVVAIGVFDKNFLIIVLISIFIVIFTPKIFAKKIEDLSEKRIILFERMLNKTKEYLSLFYVINVFNLNRIINEKYAESVSDALSSNKRLENFIGISNCVVSLVSIGTTISIYIVGGWMVLNNKLTIGGLIAVGHLVSSLSMPMLELIYGFNELSATNKIKEEIKHLIQYEEQYKRDDKEVDTLQIFIPEIKFSERQLLSNIQLDFYKGKNYAIIGDNGSGKSTIGKIITGLLKIEKGQYFINGEEISSNEIKNYDTLYVSSRNQLFDDTVFNNINLSTGKIDGKYEGEIVIDDEMMNMEVSTLLDGEKQKIILYRSLVSEFDVKIYDEPEKSLDLMTKSKIFDLLLKDREGINIVITHKLDEDLKKFDQIIYINDGLIQTFNSYDTFMQQKKAVCKSV